MAFHTKDNLPPFPPSLICEIMPLGSLSYTNCYSIYFASQKYLFILFLYHFFLIKWIKQYILLFYKIKEINKIYLINTLFLLADIIDAVLFSKVLSFSILDVSRKKFKYCTKTVYLLFFNFLILFHMAHKKNYIYVKGEKKV